MFNAAAIHQAVAEDRLGAQLESEVREHFHRLPLQAVCRNGGWPDGEALAVFVVGDVVAAGGELTMPFSLTFQEQSAAGCGNQVDSAPRAAEFTLRVAGDLCTLELRETEQEPEF